MIKNFRKVSNFHQLFLKFNWLVYKSQSSLPVNWSHWSKIKEFLKHRDSVKSGQHEMGQLFTAHGAFQ